MTEVIPERAVAPNAIIDFIVAQGTNARILGGQALVQFSEHFWRLTLRINQTIQLLPRLRVASWNRLRADCNVVAHRRMTQDILVPFPPQVPMSGYRTMRIGPLSVVR